MTDPNPQKSHVIGDESKVSAVRKLDCLNYKLCLNTAVAANWPGFTCNSCDAYERDEAGLVKEGQQMRRFLSGRNGTGK